LYSPSSWLSERETLSNLGWLCPLCKAEKRWYVGGQIWQVGKIRWAMLTGYIFPEKKRNWILRVWIDLSMYVHLALQTCRFSWKLYRSELLSDTLCTSLLQIRLSHVHSQHPCYKKMYTLTPAHEIWNIWWIYLICFSSVVGALNKSAADCFRPPFCNLSSPRCWITPAEWIKVLNQDLQWMSHTNGLNSEMFTTVFEGFRPDSSM
jgi:hypothetical protein